MLSLERSDEGRLESISLKDLERINEAAKNFQIDLILIGGYAVRAYTSPRSWRFTKDIDFITRSKDMGTLHSVFDRSNIS